MNSIEELIEKIYLIAARATISGRIKINNKVTDFLPRKKWVTIIQIAEKFFIEFGNETIHINNSSIIDMLNGNKYLIGKTSNGYLKLQVEEYKLYSLTNNNNNSNINPSKLGFVSEESEGLLVPQKKRAKKIAIGRVVLYPNNGEWRTNQIKINKKYVIDSSIAVKSGEELIINTSIGDIIFSGQFKELYPINV